MQSKSEKVIVCGTSGLIRGHLVKNLAGDGRDVARAVDITPLADWYQIFPIVTNRISDLKARERYPRGRTPLAVYPGAHLMAKPLIRTALNTRRVTGQFRTRKFDFLKRSDDHIDAINVGALSEPLRG